MSDEPEKRSQQPRWLVYVLPTTCGVCVAFAGAAMSRTWGDFATYFMAGLVGTAIVVLAMAVVIRVKNSRRPP
jgi:hypothetical protein